MMLVQCCECDTWVLCAGRSRSCRAAGYSISYCAARKAFFDASPAPKHYLKLSKHNVAEEGRVEGTKLRLHNTVIAASAQAVLLSPKSRVAAVFLDGRWCDIHAAAFACGGYVSLSMASTAWRDAFGMSFQSCVQRLHTSPASLPPVKPKDVGVWVQLAVGKRSILVFLNHATIPTLFAQQVQINVAASLMAFVRQVLTDAYADVLRRQFECVDEWSTVGWGEQASPRLGCAQGIRSSHKKRKL